MPAAQAGCGGSTLRSHRPVHLIAGEHPSQELARTTLMLENPISHLGGCQPWSAGAPLSSPRTSATVHHGADKSAISASTAFLQIRVRPPRSHPEIGYILATLGQNGSRKSAPKAQKKSPANLGGATRCGKRRAWDSNPQPLAGHLISSQGASQFAYPPGAS